MQINSVNCLETHAELQNEVLEALSELQLAKVGGGITDTIPV
jgi:hypothetical protein